MSKYKQLYLINLALSCVPYEVKRLSRHKKPIRINNKKMLLSLINIDPIDCFIMALVSPYSYE